MPAFFFAAVDNFFISTRLSLVLAEFGVACHCARLTATGRVRVSWGMTAESGWDALTGICEQLKGKREKIEN